MVQEARELAGKIEEQTPQYKTGARLLADFAASLGKQRLLPRRLPKQPEILSQESIQTPELDLDVEWQRQASEYVKFGFHATLKLTEEAYLASLPKFEPQPEEYKDRFNVPLLVETRIPWDKQAQPAGIDISDYLVSRINETKPYDDRSKTPDTPYTGWFNRWGERFTQKIAPLDARKQLLADEISGGPYEGVALQAAHPEITKSGKYFDLIGYRVGSDSIPCLHHWGGGPGLDALWDGHAHGHFRPLVRGSKIVTG